VRWFRWGCFDSGYGCFWDESDYELGGWGFGSLAGSGLLLGGYGWRFD
jgi:hypothetical protein